MKSTLRITALAAFTLVGTASFCQSLNFNGGFTTSSIKMEGMTDSESSDTYGTETYSSSEKYKNISGYNAAIAYEFKLGNRLSLETGFKMQTRGYKAEYEYSYVDGSYNGREAYSMKYKMTYVDLPIVLNTAIVNGDFKVYAKTGIYLGLMTGAKSTQRYEYSSSDGDNFFEENTEKEDMSDIDERITGGFVLGVGAEYKGFYFETNYNLGAFSLTDLDEEIYTHDISFSLGYKLKFKK